EGAAEGDLAKTARIVRPNALTYSSDRRRMEVSTVVQSGDRELIRTIPFVHVKMALAANHPVDRKYPPFDPHDIFSAEPDEITATTGNIYGARVESDVTRRSIDFPLETAHFDEKSRLSADEVEEVVRASAAILTDGAVQVAALHYVDPQRFGVSLLDNLQAGFAAGILRGSHSRPARFRHCRAARTVRPWRTGGRRHCRGPGRPAQEPDHRGRLVPASRHRALGGRQPDRPRQPLLAHTPSRH